MVVLQSTESPEAGADWLTLQEASELLGVSTSTVRRWADAGRIATRRTHGGHRRFDPAGVEAVREQAGEENEVSDVNPALWNVTPQGMASQHWHTHLTDSHANEQMRGQGQRLLGLLIQYLVWQGDTSRFLADGREVGMGYGELARAAGISLHDTVEAFLYFRRAFWGIALQIPAVARAGDAAEIRIITERMDEFMNSVLLATILGYEGASS